MDSHDPSKLQFGHTIVSLDEKNNEVASTILKEKKLKETKELDKEMIERWLGEADSIIIFAGLFSAVGAVSLVESYKWLSPDSGDQTVRLLKATVNILAQEFNSNNTGVSSIVDAGDEPFHRTLDVVAVNILWFGSMVICIGCAIASTLVQHWGRRYLELTQGYHPASNNERVRNVLFNGFDKFHMQEIRLLVGMALYTSVFLYCLGIIVFIIHIDWALAPLAASYLGLCGVLYAIVTVLPFFFLDCPFSTPFTPLTFRLYHFSMFSLFWSLRLIFQLFFRTSSRFWQALNKKAEKHRRQAQEGLNRIKALDLISNSQV